MTALTDDELDAIEKRCRVSFDKKVNLRAYARAAIAAHEAKMTKPDRTGMTYYKNNDCKAPSAEHPDCICWTLVAHEAKQAQAEPVAWLYAVNGKNYLENHQLDHSYPTIFGYVKGQPLYTHPAPKREPLTELINYILQEEGESRLTPRVVDIAYSAFMIGRSGKNKDDGGPCDWFNDTKPMVIEQLIKIRKDLAAHGIKEAP